jgi:quinol-cytochrome oxidoreductase complex cytochrome b subunit
MHAAKVHPHSLKPTYTFGLGLMLGFLFLIMIITGLVLMLHYTPSVGQAYDSVKDIIFIVPGGRYIRNIHRWAAHGMVLVAFLHLARVFYTGSYLRSRTTNWIIGVSMLAVVLFMNFSGYLLPWDQLAFWAITIGSNIAASARELTDILGITHMFDAGGFLKRLLIGDETVGQPALTRFFMLHVVFLPLTLLVLTAVHFWQIRKDGGLARPYTPEASSERYPAGRVNFSGSDQDGKWYSWPVLMWAELATLLLVSAAVLGMAFLIDAPLKEQANPSFPENPAKSPWYFLGIQELVSYSAFSGGMLIPLLFLIFLISIPYVDKEDRYTGTWFSGSIGIRITLWSVAYTIAVTVFILLVYIRSGWIRDWIPAAPQLITMIINPATLSGCLYILWATVVRKKMQSTRFAAIALFTCTLTALIIFTAIGIWFRGPNWEFFWPGKEWPVQ